MIKYFRKEPGTMFAFFVILFALVFYIGCDAGTGTVESPEATEEIEETYTPCDGWIEISSIAENYRCFQHREVTPAGGFEVRVFRNTVCFPIRSTTPGYKHTIPAEFKPCVDEMVSIK
jgi:hypothetical protein